jgi:hypothetical protein
MRAFPLIACAALALSACGKKETADQGGNATQDVSAETLGPGGDTTAIDAATSADANMAADVEYNATDLNLLDNESEELDPAANAD